MNSADRLADCISGELGMLVRGMGNDLAELRIRSGQAARLRLMSGEEIAAETVSSEELQRMLARMMGDSLYACEEELRQGYFTMACGCRVGVCGRLNARSGSVQSMASVGSVCVRLHRDVKGCAESLIWHGRPEGMLILSPPGMGKTTMLRDLARLASEKGWNVAIADERREIAACFEGVPQFDIGSRTDVMDGCPKAISMGLLVRACAPDVIIADEVGNEGDVSAIEDAARCGVAVVATAHASGIEDARLRLGEMVNSGIFRRVVLLGPVPGRIDKIWNLDMKGEWNVEGRFADDCAGGMRSRRTDVVKRPEEKIGNAGRNSCWNAGSSPAHAQFHGTTGDSASQIGSQAFQHAGKQPVGRQQPERMLAEAAR